MIDHRDYPTARKTESEKSQHSLLDRLSPPDQLSANIHRQNQTHIKESIRRDLEMLLNTRLLRHDISRSLRHVRHSIVNYGVVDITSRPMHNEQQRVDFARELAKTIARFEPRLRNVNVNINVTRVTESKQHMHFRIDAALAVGSTLQPVCFKSEMEHSAARICLSEILQ